MFLLLFSNYSLDEAVVFGLSGQTDSLNLDKLIGDAAGKVSIAGELIYKYQYFKDISEIEDICY